MEASHGVVAVVPAAEASQCGHGGLGAADSGGGGSDRPIWLDLCPRRPAQCPRGPQPHPSQPRQLEATAARTRRRSHQFRPPLFRLPAAAPRPPSHTWLTPRPEASQAQVTPPAARHTPGSAAGRLVGDGMGKRMLQSLFNLVVPRKHAKFDILWPLYRCTACLWETQRRSSTAPFMHEHSSIWQ
jgi:hypothetical protein